VHRNRDALTSHSPISVRSAHSRSGGLDQRLHLAVPARRVGRDHDVAGADRGEDGMEATRARVGEGVVRQGRMSSQPFATCVGGSPSPRGTSLGTRPAPADDSGWWAWDRVGWRNNRLHRVERAKRMQSTKADPYVGAFASVDLDLGLASQENWSAILSSHRSAAYLTWSRSQIDGVDVEAEPSDLNRNRRSAAWLKGTARLARPIDDRYAFRADSLSLVSANKATVESPV